MKIPENKLPLRMDTRHGVYGQYSLNYITKEDSIPTSKYAGRISGKELSEYVVTAPNKFPEALKLIEYFVNRVEEGSIRSQITYLKYKDFLKSLEND